MLKKIIFHKYLLWLLLMYPGIEKVFWYAQDKLNYGRFMHISGELSAKFLIITLIATPLALIIREFKMPKWGALLVTSLFIISAIVVWIGTEEYRLKSTINLCIAYIIFIIRVKVVTWLLQNRRIVYLLKEPLFIIFQEFIEIGVLAGWIAFIIWIPLAITSNNKSVKRLKKKWKSIQIWTYPAAIFVVLHWGLIHNHWRSVLFFFTPVLLLQMYRVTYWFRTRKKLTFETLIYK